MMQSRKDVREMSDIFLCLLVFLMIAYAFWDDLFTN